MKKSIRLRQYVFSGECVAYSLHPNFCTMSTVNSSSVCVSIMCIIYAYVYSYIHMWTHACTHICIYFVSSLTIQYLRLIQQKLSNHKKTSNDSLFIWAGYLCVFRINLCSFKSSFTKLHQQLNLILLVGTAIVWLCSFSFQSEDDFLGLRKLNFISLIFFFCWGACRGWNSGPSAC